MGHARNPWIHRLGRACAVYGKQDDLCIALQLAMIGQQKFFQDSKQTQPVYTWWPFPFRSRGSGRWAFDGWPNAAHFPLFISCRYKNFRSLDFLTPNGLRR